MLMEGSAGRVEGRSLLQPLLLQQSAHPWSSDKVDDWLDDSAVMTG